MSIEHHDDNCPGCRPVMFDEDRRPLPDDSPPMKAALRAWATTTVEERRAFHRVVVNNSRDPADMAVVEALGQKIQAVLNAN